MKVLALVVVLGLVGAGQALKCYTCSSVASSAQLPEDLMKMLSSSDNPMPSCDGFDPAKPMKKFEQECPLFHNGCLKMQDPNNPKTVVRSCFVLAQDQCDGPLCYCAEDLCNGSGQAWPSVTALLTGVAAALLGGR